MSFQNLGSLCCNKRRIAGNLYRMIGETVIEGAMVATAVTC